jgi:hypothetical protein
MSGHHPDPQILERFMRNEAGAQERRAVILHLLTGCAQCVAVTRRLWYFAETPPDAGSRRQRRARTDREAAPSRPADTAEIACREAMRESLLAGLGREAARALLDLAQLYVRQNRSAELQRLAEELYPICRVPGVGMSVTMALLFFRGLVETGFATQDVLFEVALFLGDSPSAQQAGGAQGNACRQVCS